MTTATDDLALYVGRGCGYCADVLDVLRELDVELEERDAWIDPTHRTELLAARGRRTVPVLRIRGDDEPDRWMGESQDIIEYLYGRFGDETHRRSLFRRVASHRGTVAAMWILLLAGGVSADPAQSLFWIAACGVASARSLTFAIHSGAWIHWGIFAAFASGVLSISLAVLDIADIPWWYLAFAITVVAALGGWAGRVRATPSAEV